MITIRRTPGVVLVISALVLAACSSSTKSASTTVPAAANTAAASSAAPSATSPAVATSGAASVPSAASETTADPSGAATTVAAKPTGTPFVIGSTQADTGTGNLRPVGDGLAAFVAYANADGGGFGGHPGNLKRCDTGNDPQKASDCARQIADDASTVVAMSTGRYADTAVATLGSASPPVPYICPGIVRPPEGNSPNTLCLYAGSPMGTYAALTYFKTKGLTKGYFLTPDSDAGHATAAFTATFAGDLGQTMQSAFFPAAQADFLPVAQAALAAKPDFIIFGAGVAQELAITQAFVTLDSTVPMGTWSALLPQSSMDQLKSAKFYIVMDALTPDAASSTDPEIVLYRTWMTSQGNGDELGDYSLQGWLVGRAMQSAANQVGGDLSRASILKVIRTGQLNIPLLKNPVSLANAPKTPGYSSVANATVTIAVVQNGIKNYLDQTATLP